MVTFFETFLANDASRVKLARLTFPSYVSGFEGFGTNALGRTLGFLELEDVKKLLYEFYFKLFQSFKFKQHLGLSFSANFEIVSMS